MKVHDVVQDVGISISSDAEYGFWAGAGRKLYRCPKLLTLQLEGNQSLSIIPASFFQGTKELRVLNLEGIGTSSIGCSLSCLSKVRV